MDVGSSTGAPDGKADLVLVDSEGGTLRVYTFLSNGDGTFTTRVDKPWKDPNGNIVPYGAIDLQNWRAAAIDADGLGDLIHPISIGSGVRVESLRSRGDGTWQLAGPDYFPQSVPNLLLAGHDFIVADISGDGRSDLVHAQGNSMTATHIAVAARQRRWHVR